MLNQLLKYYSHNKGRHIHDRRLLEPMRLSIRVIHIIQHYALAVRQHSIYIFVYVYRMIIYIINLQIYIIYLTYLYTACTY